MKQSFLPAIIGGIISIAVFTMGFFQFILIEKFLVFAFFVIVPLVIQLINDKNQTKLRQSVYQWITRLQFPAAFLALASLMASRTWGMENALVSGILSIGWLLFTLLLAVYGFLIIIEKGLSYIEELAIGAGVIYFFVGGIWYTFYQFKTNILHLGPSVSALSAIHFHYSSAIVPIFIGMLGRVMVKKSWYKWLVGIDIIGPIMIAFGIVFSKQVEVIGVTLFACNITIYSTYLLIRVREVLDKKRARSFLRISSLAVYGIIVLAILFAIVKKFSLFPLSITDMVLMYGSLHTFGFVLCGLLGWIEVKPTPKSSIRRV